LINKLKILLQLFRPLNIFQGIIASLIGYWLVGGGYTLKLVAGVLVVTSYIAAGNAINDYFDYKIDRVNNPNRPIPAGKIGKNSVLILAIAGFILGLLVTIPVLNLMTGIISILTVSLLILYTPVFKDSVLWGNLVVSLVLGLTFLFITSIFQQPISGIIPGILAFMFNFIREIVKDMEDIEGDKQEGLETFPVRYGLEKSRNIVIGGIIITVIGLPLPYFIGIYSQYYLISVLITVALPLLYTIYRLKQDLSTKTCAWASSLLKYDVFFGLISIFLGKV